MYRLLDTNRVSGVAMALFAAAVQQVSDSRR
jgi:hypothetical protein